ncbi:MAG: M23 family metallopeptidase [Patescibacteria group bacterium]
MSWKNISVPTALLLSLLWPPNIARAETVRSIVFPVDGSVHYTDTWGEARSGGRTHEGTDIMGEHLTPLVAAADGFISFITIPEASWGYALAIQDAEGWEYWYLHINNDSPGTDDGQGGLEYAFAPGINQGVRVSAGQLVAWMGDSGNAEYAGNHLHFEIHTPDDVPINPYASLLAAERPNMYDVAAVRASAQTVDDDKGLTENFGWRYCLTGTLLTTPLDDTVYYCGADGKRYVFPDRKTYETWYDDFSRVQLMSIEEIANIPFGGMVTYRPGVQLVKIQTDPRVFAVSKGAVLRWVSSPEIAAELYGANWAKQVHDIPDAFFTNYTIGEPITHL